MSIEWRAPSLVTAALLCFGAGSLACSGGADRRPSEAPLPTACSTDADCNTCAAPRCGCAATSAACAPQVEACFVDPCGSRRAVCRDSACVLEPAPETAPPSEGPEVPTEAPSEPTEAPPEERAPEAPGETPPRERPSAPSRDAPAASACRTGECTTHRCIRAVSCARACGEEAVMCGCCSCAEGFIDTITCG